jgi:5-carboxymethyl-2-hydroxymuconate isomerase
MPHIIIEHSSDFKDSLILDLSKAIQQVMQSITKGNFDLSQCKGRNFSFDSYLVGSCNQNNSSFIHVTIKILAGRDVEIKKELAQKTFNLLRKFYGEVATNLSLGDRLLEIGEFVADAISGVPHIQDLTNNNKFAGKMCDLSLDIVDMEREFYQKMRIEN